MSSHDLVVHERPGEGPTVLALHGMSSTAEVWSDLEHRLAGQHLVAPNLPGRGPSRDVPAPPGMRGLADAVLDLVAGSAWGSAASAGSARLSGSAGSAASKGLAGSAASAGSAAPAGSAGGLVVVGHSMGAFLAPIVVRRLADSGFRVRGVLLLDGGPTPTPSWATNPLLVRALFTVAAMRMRAQLSLRAPYDAVDCLTRPTRLGQLAGLDVPVHLIAAAHGAGPDDPEFLSDAAIEAGRSVLPRMTWERLDATHESMLTHPGVAEAVRRLS